LSSLKKMHKGFIGVGTVTAISRVLGYIRDGFIAYFFGTKWLADSFFVAFRIPNLLRQLLGEGSMPAAFIPTYCEVLSKEEKERAMRLVGNMFTAMFLLSTVLVLLGVFFAPLVVKLIAPGFRAESRQFFTTVTLARIMFPVLLLVNISTIAMGVLNARKYFTIPATGPALFNLTLIFYFLLSKNISDDILRAKCLAVAVVGGFVANFLIMLPVLLKEKVTKLRYFYDGVFSNKDVKKVFLLLLPAVLGISMMELNVFVDTICASLIGEGTISALYYAHRVNQLPLALFGVTISMVSLPFLSYSQAMNKKEQTSSDLFGALSASYFLIIPSIVGLFLLSDEIIALLFQRGHFVKISTITTAGVLKFYALGLFAFSGIKIFANYFYSKKDTKTPVIIAGFSFLINALLDVILMFPLGARGLALGTSIAAAFNFFWLGWLILRETNIRPGKEFFLNLGIIFVSSAVMAVFLIYFKNTSVIFKIPLGAVVYFLFWKALSKIAKN